MNRVAKLLVSVLSLSLLGVLFWFADLGRIGSALAGVRVVEYGLAALVFASTYVLLAVRWRVLGRTADLALSLRASFEIVAISYGLNKILPANAGDLVRSKVSQRYVSVESHGALLGLVTVERLADVGSIGLAVVLSSLFLSGTPDRTIRVVAVGVAIGCFVAAFGLVRILPRVSLSERLPLSETIRSELRNTSETFGALSIHRLSYVGVLSLARWIVLGVSFQLLGAALGLGVTLPAAVLVTTTMSLAAVVPLSPGGLGPVDAVGTGVLVLLNVEYSQALTLVVLQRSLGLVLMALVGLAVYNYRLAVPPSRGSRD